MFTAGLGSPHLAGGAGEARRAFAHESVQQGVAAPAVPARIAGTAVPLHLTVSAHEARLADTLVAPGQLLGQRNRTHRRRNIS